MPASGSSSPTSIRHSVVLPTPLRPMMATFSPLVTSAVKSSQTSTPGPALGEPLDGERLLARRALHQNWMNGRSMFDFLRSASCSFSICFLRLCTCEARVPAPKRATKSWSCKTSSPASPHAHAGAKPKKANRTLAAAQRYSRGSNIEQPFIQFLVKSIGQADAQGLSGGSPSPKKFTALVTKGKRSPSSGEQHARPHCAACHPAGRGRSYEVAKTTVGTSAQESSRRGWGRRCRTPLHSFGARSSKRIHSLLGKIYFKAKRGRSPPFWGGRSGAPHLLNLSLTKDSVWVSTSLPTTSISSQS